MHKHPWATIIFRDNIIANHRSLYKVVNSSVIVALTDVSAQRSINAFSEPFRSRDS